MPSYEEKFPGQAERLSGKFDSVRTEKSVNSETQDLDMHINQGENAEALDNNRMTAAVKHLERDTQRGEHAPMVGGYLHDHKMR
jgi:hypothetical protein